jgi:transposase
MRNLTSLFGLDARYRYHRMGRKILVARWDWDEVFGGIVQCPSCGQRDRPPWKNGTGIARQNNIKDRPVGGAPLEIDLQCQRYKCPECRASFGSTHPGIKRNSNLTIRLINHLALRSRGPETQAQIARRTGVARSTVRKYFTEYLVPPPEMPDHPEAIGIDGVHVGAGGPLVVVTALGGDKNHVLEVLKDQTKHTLRTYLNGLEPAQKPLPVVIDMSTTFKGAVQDSRLPIALVIDRYQVARLANLALGHCRNDLIGGSDVEGDWEDRKEEIYNRAQASSGKQLRIEGAGTKELDQMAQAYKATLWFRWILTAEISREEADEELGRWKNSIDPPIREHFENDVFGTLGRWRNEILNYYDYRYTNGFNEGINNLVKKLDRIGANYSRETLQSKLRHHQAHRRTFNHVIAAAATPDASAGTQPVGLVDDHSPDVSVLDVREKLLEPLPVHGPATDAGVFVEPNAIDVMELGPLSNFGSFASGCRGRSPRLVLGWKLWCRRRQAWMQPVGVGNQADRRNLTPVDLGQFLHIRACTGLLSV